MAGSGGLRDLGWDLRRNWLSRLHAAANRTAPRRTGCHFDFLAFVYGVTSDQRLGDILMDIGLFAFCWTGIAGDFGELPISQTGVDRPFFIACATFTTSLLIVLLAISRLRREGLSIS